MSKNEIDDYLNSLEEPKRSTLSAPSANDPRHRSRCGAVHRIQTPSVSSARQGHRRVRGLQEPPQLSTSQRIGLPRAGRRARRVPDFDRGSSVCRGCTTATGARQEVGHGQDAPGPLVIPHLEDAGAGQLLPILITCPAIWTPSGQLFGAATFRAALTVAPARGSNWLGATIGDEIRPVPKGGSS